MYKVEVKMIFRDFDSEEEILLAQTLKTFKKDFIITTDCLRDFVSEDKRDFLELQFKNY